MPSFEIPDGPATTALKPQNVKGQTVRAGSATFSVTNKSGQPLAGRVSILPQGDAKAAWFEIGGEKERSFAASETQKISVDIKAPANAPVGDYKFRLRVVNVNDPDNDYTDSPVVTFNVPAVDGPPPFPWWILAVVGAVLLVVVVGGVIAYVVFSGPGQVQVPDVVTAGMTYDKAAAQISTAGLNPVQNPTPATSGTPGNVVDENPKAGTQVDAGSTVTLTVAKAAPPPPPPSTPMVTVPDVSTQGYAYAEAKGILEANQFVVTEAMVAATGKAPGTVIAQSPAANTQIAANNKAITLSVDPGVSVPDVSSGMNLTFQSAYNSLHYVGLEIGQQFCKVDPAHVNLVLGQNPGTGTVVAKGSNVALTLGAANCFIFIPHKFIPLEKYVGHNP